MTSARARSFNLSAKVSSCLCGRVEAAALKNNLRSALRNGSLTARFAMEAKRQLDVLNRRLDGNDYLAGEEYSIADMAVYPWYGWLALGKIYEAGTFLSVHEYPHVIRWAEEISQRPAVKRGTIVNKAWGEPEEQLHTRHDASDFELRTQDKIGETPDL